MSANAVIVDTNVFVAAGFNRQSASACIVAEIRSGRLRMIWNEQTRRETQYILNKIPPLSWSHVAACFRDEDRHHGETALDPFDHIPDPDDRKFAALAKAAGVVLLTNDHDLLSGRDQAEIEILTPGEYLTDWRPRMDSAPSHRTAIELELGLTDVHASPQDVGLLEAIFVRPRQNERVRVTSAELSPAGGVAGDRWALDHWQKLPDGSPDPRSQISLMNARILRLIAGDENAMGLAGDNLILDFDLAENKLPAGSRLRIGAHVVLEITAQSHTGCGKFARRYGSQACEFVNSPQVQHLNLRGRFARVVEGGTVQVGDPIAKVEDVGPHEA